MTVAVFLPGILMPASARYSALFAQLDVPVPLITKELEVYAGPEPPPGYSVDTEVEGLHRFLAEQVADRIHLYGHSAGGAIALAFTALHPERVATLALDEPASDFSDDDRAAIDALGLDGLDALPPPERLRAFAATLVAPGVTVEPPPAPPPGPETAKRPAGLLAFRDALVRHRVDEGALGAFAAPVYYSYGSLTHPRWEAMASRLQGVFPDIEIERYEGIHHLHTSHSAEPARVADALRRLWDRAG